MASLNITIGTLNESLHANNTKASNLLNAYAASIGATGTNQEIAQAVLVALVRHMQQEAKRQRRNAETVAALAEIESELDALKWE